MLQQTRVETVIPYYTRFLHAFPTVAELANAPLERVLALWAGLGYYARARNLHRAARQIADGPGFPRTEAELRELPGVGRYMAAAIASIAFGEPAAALDGNIRRVYARLTALDQPAAGGAGDAFLWRAAQERLDSRRPGDFNQALMELGATVCTPRRPRCADCPVRAGCRAAQAGRQHEIPVAIPKRAPRVVRGWSLWLTHGERVLMAERPAGGLLGGLWGPPGALHERDTNGSNCAISPGRIAAYFFDMYGLDISKPVAIGSVRHLFTHRRLDQQVYAARWLGGRLRRVMSGVRARWTRVDDLDSLPLSTLDRKVIRLARADLRR
jgi:A/G-specific adenine glycosylase